MTTKKKRLIITGPSGGGTTKTSTAVLIASLARFAGLSVRLVDADVTTRGLLNWLGEERVLRLSSEPTEAQSFPAMLLEAAVDDDLIIIDAGAGALMMPVIGQTVMDCASQFRSVGWTITVALALVSAKAGLEKDVERAVKMFSSRADVFAFCAGAPPAAFARYDELLGSASRIEVRSIPSELLSMLATGHVDAMQFIKAPPAGYSRAAGWLAADLLAIAKQASMDELFDCSSAAELLRDHAEAAPKRRYRRPDSLHDTWLTADERKLKADDHLQRVLLDDADGVLMAARAYVKACRARAELR
jgi:hypothetical protein